MLLKDHVEIHGFFLFPDNLYEGLVNNNEVVSGSKGKNYNKAGCREIRDYGRQKWYVLLSIS